MQTTHLAELQLCVMPLEWLGVGEGILSLRGYLSMYMWKTKFCETLNCYALLYTKTHVYSTYTLNATVNYIMQVKIILLQKMSIQPHINT